MAKKDQLRQLRENTIINEVSKIQEKSLELAIKKCILKLQKTYPTLELCLEQRLFLYELVSFLETQFQNLEFSYHMKTSSMKPDGGILYLVNKSNERYPILISEKKNQGTNDQRKLESKKKQAKGNAIERLGKNVIGFRTFLANESIFPFVCFGDGCDFSDDSSILDRVSTIAEFGKINTIYVHNEAENRFRRGSFFFRETHWTLEEMTNICFEIAEKSIFYYFSKYGKSNFL
jgi:type II restriction enzyme